MSTKTKGIWKEEDMKKAVDGVLAGKFSFREASSFFTVPKSTLQDRVKHLKEGKCTQMAPSMGRFKNTFTDTIEDELVNHIKDLDNRMLPLTKSEFLKLVFDLAEHMKIQHRFNKTKRSAGNKFYREFMKRHPEFSLRSPESTSLQRATGFNKLQVNLFFSKYEELLNKHSFLPNRIFNCDETGVSIVHENSLKVMSIKGKKQVSKLTSGERGRNITVLLCINAAGDQFIPPLFVFPRARIDLKLKKDAPEGSIFDAQDSGWITVSGFLKWLEAFVKHVHPTKESPVLLILDGHSTHKDLQVILFAKENYVHMLSLPPHTTHKLQPLDRTIMKPFKAVFNEACGTWMQTYGRLGLKISEQDICGLVNKAFTAVCRMELAKSAFKCTGIYPFNRNIFKDIDFLPSLNRTLPEENVEKNIVTDVSASLASKDVSTSSPLRTLDINTATVTASVPETVSDSNFDHAIPSTSTQFQNVIQQISPVGEKLQRKICSRKRRGERSEVLTSTPYKNKLEEKEEAKRQKRDRPKAEKGKKSMEEKVKVKQVQSKMKARSVRRKIDFNTQNTSHKTRNPTKEDDSKQEETQCVICGETFLEDWVQCLICNGWAHVNCADSENVEFFICDLCK